MTYEIHISRYIFRHTCFLWWSCLASRFRRIICFLYCIGFFSVFFVGIYCIAWSVKLFSFVLFDLVLICQISHAGGVFAYWNLWYFYNSRVWIESKKLFIQLKAHIAPFFILIFWWDYADCTIFFQNFSLVLTSLATFGYMSWGTWMEKVYHQYLQLQAPLQSIRILRLSLMTLMGQWVQLPWPSLSRKLLKVESRDCLKLPQMKAWWYFSPRRWGFWDWLLIFFSWMSSYWYHVPSRSGILQGLGL